jgi:hypothetical protein
MNNYQNSSSKPTTKTNKININNEEKEFYNDNNGSINISIRKKLKKIKNYSIGKYAIPNVSSPVNSERDPLNINIQNKNSSIPVKKNHQSHYEESNLNTLYFEKLNNINNNINQKNEINQNLNNDSSTICKDELISNALNLNIPIKLRIEIERNKKTSDIIEILRNMDELKLEKNPQYTEFVVLSKNKYVKLDSVIDETFLNFEQISIYELLNYEGIKKIFGYEDLKEKANILEKQDLQSMLQISEDDEDSIKKNNYNNNDSPKVENKNKNDVKNKKNNEEISEVLVTVLHEYRTLPIDKEDEHLKLFNLTQSSVINNNLDFIILTNKNAIRPVDLYELIWEKYMYYINSPTKYESSLWWKPYSFSSFSSSKN